MLGRMRGRVSLVAVALVVLPFAVALDAFGATSRTPVPASSNGNQQLLADPSRPFFYLADPAGSTVQFLDAATGKVNTTIPVGLGPNSIDLSRDRASLFIAVSGEDKIAVVDIAERSVTRNLTLNFTPLSVRDGRSDRLYVTGSDRVVRVLNGTTGQELANSSLFSYQTIAEVSPDGSLLLLTTTDVSALVIAAFDIQNDTPAFLRYSHPDLGGTFRQEAVDWTGGRIYLASGSPYGLEIVSIATLDRLGMLPMESYPTGVALAADGSTVYGLSANGNGAAVWAFDVATGVLQRLERLGRQADLVAVSGDRRGLIVGSPIERIAIEPSLGPWQPAPGIQCFSPSVLLAQLVRGLPDVGVDAATIRLDGSALSTDVYSFVSYNTFHLLRANLSVPLSEGPHTIDADVRWEGQSIHTAWTFGIDYGAGSPTCPSIGPGRPGPGEIVDVVPSAIEASLWSGSPSAEIESASMTLQGRDVPSTLTPDGRVQYAVLAPLPDGRYNVTARIAWRGGEASTSWNFTIDTDFSIPRIPLVEYVHPAGFRLPIPEGWTVQTDASIGTEKIDLLVIGPSYFGVQESLGVVTTADPTVRENDSFLAQVAQDTVQGLRTPYPDAQMSGAPRFRSVDGHAAVTFVVEYGTRSVIQEFAVVVSEVHQRGWILVLTAYTGQFPMLNTTFGQIIDGFVITLAPPSPPPPAPGPQPKPAGVDLGLYLQIGEVAAATTVLLAIILIRRSHAPGRRTSAIPLSTPIRFCPRCGTPVEPIGRWCPRCGEILRGPPPGTGPPS